MDRLMYRFGRSPTMMLLAFAVLCYTPAALADDPVTVTVDVEGDAVPLGTVTATATVDIMDGSTLQSIHWEQVWGVDAAISGADTDTATVMLGAEGGYKDFLIHLLSEPPVEEEDLPPNVPLPEGEFPGGLQDRFHVVGMDPFSLEETALVALEVEVVTTSGTYHGEGEIHTAIPWKPSPGLRTAPIGIPMLLHGKEQESYDWALDPPPGSSATLMDATTQNPEFIPDVPGLYKIEVTDMTDDGKAGPVLLRIYGGTWRGAIVDQDGDGRPVADAACLGCHSGAPAADQFTPWAQTGHAEIFTNNLNTSTHYGPGCFACHTVGFDPDVENGGIDEADDYQDFLDAGLLNNPGDNWTTVLNQFPDTAQMANIQCENCHGPQDVISHSNGAPRTSLSSNVCATCHGEPRRHARFQQWQLSGHANYELAIDEGDSGNCSRCHTGNGFLTWLPILLGEEDGDPLESIEVTWTTDETHPQTCQTCHDPHSIGTTSGSDPNATVRISGDTPPLIAGFTATDVGRGATCMTCHNTRRGLRNDETFEEFFGTSEAARAPHGGAQTDVLMGQNAYLVEVGTRGLHSKLEDTCIDCHMEATPPPDVLSYNQGGTNHTFFARNDICSECHSVVTAEDVQGPVAEGMMELQDRIEDALLDLMEEQIASGRTIDLNGDATITDTSDIMEIEFGEARGRQAIAVYFTGGMVVGPHRISDIDVVPGSGDAFGLYDVADRRLIKSGWNWNLINNDGSTGVHNPGFVKAILKASNDALERAAAGAEDGVTGGAVGGGPGDGSGAVACTSPYVYWLEIASHNAGADGSVWRTDLVTRNMVTSAADVEFVLHRGSGNVTTDGAVGAAGQAVFEDIVGMMGVEDGKGSLEICSDQPLQVVARIFNEGGNAKVGAGTFGQFLDGHVGGTGLANGESARLLGLRQLQGAFRTNISATNTGTEPAEVRVTLYSNSAADLHSYTLGVGIGMVVQDLQPFKTRAGRPNIGWGFALVEVTEGSGVLTSASVIDAVTGDATTIPMKR
jgi:formate-dependent nitrite reductase cytochrome c552 subunit